MQKKIVAFVFVAIAILAPTIYYFCHANKKQPPNIILILADDMGRNDVSFLGSNQIQTPNLDALAYHGQILHHFYAQSLCTPSRAALLTGQYPIRSGLQGQPISAGENRSLPDNFKLLPQYLQELGYKTHLVGKWHLGAALRSQTPTRKGFDTHYGYWNGFIGYFDHEAFQEIPNGDDYHGYDFFNKFSPQYEARDQYATDLFTNEAVRLLNEHNVNEPIFMMLSHLAAHTGSNGTELGVKDINETNQKFNYIENENRRRYADILTNLDESIGTVISKLSEKAMLENSIIIFLSDNGAPTIGIYGNEGSNWPLRGIKATEFEGGVRVAATIFSPLLQKRGIVNKHPIHITDLLPTLYSLGGGKVSNLGKIDGHNQWETISLNKPSAKQEFLLNINEKEENSALIGFNGQFKLINASYGIFDNYFGESGRKGSPEYNILSVLKSKTNSALTKLTNHQLNQLEINQIRKETEINCGDNLKNQIVNCKPIPCLFNLWLDPCETTNIFNDNQNIAQTLIAKLDQYQAKLVPQTNLAVDPNSNPLFYNNTWCTWLDTNYCKKDAIF